MPFYQISPGGGGSSYTDEQARDVIAAALVAGANITITPNDGADTITIAASTGTTYTDENARDAIASALVAGSNVTITPNDGADTITISATDTNTTDAEVVRDTIASALVAGSNITITPNDGADTITIAASAGSSLTVQDENSNVATNVSQLDFQGAAVTAASGSGEVVVTVSNTAGTAAIPPSPRAGTAQTGMIAQNTTATITVPTGVVTTDYVFLTCGFNFPTSTPTGFSATGNMAFTSFYGSGVKTYHRTGLQAGDTFTVTIPNSGNNAAYNVVYMKDVTSVGSFWTQGLSNTVPMGTLTAATPGLASHQIEMVAAGFTADPSGLPTTNSLTSIASVSGASGAGPNAQAVTYTSSTGLPATFTYNGSNSSGSVIAFVLTGTPPTGQQTTFTEVGTGSVATPPAGQQTLFIDSSDHVVKVKNSAGSLTTVSRVLEVFTLAVSDETTSITTGTSKITFRIPYAFTCSQVRASLSTASTSGNPAVDVNDGGVSIFSTTLTIDANEKTSQTAATPAVISGTTHSFADDAEVTVDIDTAGTGAKGLKITLIGYRT